MLFKTHEQSVLCLQYNGSVDATIVIQNLSTEEIQRLLNDHNESVMNLQFNDNYIGSIARKIRFREFFN